MYKMPIFASFSHDDNPDAPVDPGFGRALVGPALPKRAGGKFLQVVVTRRLVRRQARVELVVTASIQVPSAKPGSYTRDLLGINRP